MSVQRRPRIPDQLADEIDQLRGREPFESFVRSTLEEYIRVHSTVTGRNRIRWATGPEKVFHMIAGDFWNGDHEEFQRDVAAGLALWGEELDRQAVEDEHDDTI